MEDLHVAMNALWQSIGELMKRSVNDDNKLVLSAFNVYCFRCKECRHKLHECPKKGQEKSGSGSAKKFNGKFNSCGKTGHMEKNCWSKAENTHKRPQWLKDKDQVGEQANVNIEK